MEGQEGVGAKSRWIQEIVREGSGGRGGKRK